jgi:hypothetical protein
MPAEHPLRRAAGPCAGRRGEESKVGSIADHVVVDRPGAANRLSCGCRGTTGHAAGGAGTSVSRIVKDCFGTVISTLSKMKECVRCELLAECRQINWQAQEGATPPLVIRRPVPADPDVEGPAPDTGGETAATPRVHPQGR